MQKTVSTIPFCNLPQIFLSNKISIYVVHRNLNQESITKKFKFTKSIQYYTIMQYNVM